jgi:iron complex transport system ATP-binding protein
VSESWGDPAARGRNVVELTGVEFAYDTQRADARVIDGLSATLVGGRITALIGPNAAGKSTLLRLMLGHLSPGAGRITLDGHDVHSVPARKRAAAMSYAPQRGGSSFAFTVDEVVRMGRFAQEAGFGAGSAEDDEAVDRAMDKCELGAIRLRVFNRLSLGQQQRVLLARAMAQARRTGRVMLLDEPGSAMDLLQVHRMMALLKRLADDGMAVLVVLHDLNLVTRYADHVWVLGGGKLVASGPWSEVVTPEILSPVYGVSMKMVSVAGMDRPMVAVEGRAGGG